MKTIRLISTTEQIVQVSPLDMPENLVNQIFSTLINDEIAVELARRGKGVVISSQTKVSHEVLDLKNEKTPAVEG